MKPASRPRPPLDYPIYHISTPSMSNFVPSSLNGSFPKVKLGLLIPFSQPSSIHSP